MAKRHKARVREMCKKDKEALRTIYADRYEKAYYSSCADFKSLLKYQQHIDQVDAVGGTSSSVSTSDLHSKASATLKGQPHHSSSDSPQFELGEDFIKRLFQNAKKSLDGPPPSRPFAPSLEQIRLSRKAKDEETDQLLARQDAKTSLPFFAANLGRRKFVGVTSVMDIDTPLSE